MFPITFRITCNRNDLLQVFKCILLWAIMRGPRVYMHLVDSNRDESSGDSSRPLPSLFLSLSLSVISSLYWKPCTRRKCKHAYTAACITWRRSHLSSSTSDETSGSVSRSPDRMRQWRIGLGWFLITYHPSLFPRVPSPRVYTRNRQLADQVARF